MTGFLCYEFWGGSCLEGLYMEGIIFGILWYYSRLLTTPTFKGNRKTFKLLAVQAKVRKTLGMRKEYNASSMHSSLQGQQEIPYIDILKKALNIKA